MSDILKMILQCSKTNIENQKINSEHIVEIKNLKKTVEEQEERITKLERIIDETTFTKES